jgi:hypothetical protein
LNPHLTIDHPATPATHAAPGCASCHADVHGSFCSRCGEAAAAHAPTVHEFVHEFVGHYVALEGKLWGTLRLLLFKPGQLTLDYLRGRRVPTIHPLRLYLSLSLVMFALIRLYGVDLPRISIDATSYGASYEHRVPDPADPKRIGTARIAIKAEETKDDEAHPLREAITRLGSANEAWARNVERFMRTPPEEQAQLLNHGLLVNLPYMLIGALPLFALYLKLMFRRAHRTYGEHLVFALHASAFGFLLTSTMILIPGNLAWIVLCIHQRLFAMISVWDCLQLLPVAWILAYLPAALRRVYGGGAWASRARALVLMTVHLLVVAALVIGAEALAILRHA